MNTSSCRYGGYSRLRSGARAGVLASVMGLLAVLQSPTAASQAAGAAPEVTAQWQDYDLQFHYFGLTTYYSCSGFEDRLEQILRELGANPDVRVSVVNCSGLNDISQWQWARIRVRMPTAPAAVAADSFVAASKVISLRVHNSGQSGSGDCELLEEVRDQLLPALKMELLKDDLHCVPGQASQIGQSLQVKTLIPAKDK